MFAYTKVPRAAATGCRFLPSPGDLSVAVSRPLLPLAMDHFIALVLPEAETRWSSNISGESVITLSFSLFITIWRVAFWRRCSNTGSTEETVGDKTNFKRAEYDSGKWKRRLEKSSGPYGSCRCTVRSPMHISKYLPARLAAKAGRWRIWRGEIKEKKRETYTQSFPKERESVLVLNFSPFFVSCNEDRLEFSKPFYSTFLSRRFAINLRRILN